MASLARLRCPAPHHAPSSSRIYRPPDLADASSSVPMKSPGLRAYRGAAPPLHTLVAAGSAANRRIIEHILRRGRYRSPDRRDRPFRTRSLRTPSTSCYWMCRRPGEAPIIGWRRAQPDLSVIALVGAAPGSNGAAATPVSTWSWQADRASCSAPSKRSVVGRLPSSKKARMPAR
jgi:hypothetical protein